MPAEVLSRIPLPSLRVYTALSVLLVAGCVYYSFSVTSDPSWKQNVNITQHYPPVSLEEALEIKLNGGGGGEEAAAMADREVHRVVESVKGGEMELLSEMQAYEGEGGDYRTIMDLLKDMMSFMGQEAICIWTLINMAYCCLILLGRTIQRIVFGELRISEQQHMKDKFWNYVFYKFIFVFGVVNVQYLNEVILWVSWFSVLGFLHLLSQLCKDRFEYLSFSPTTPGWSHFRLVALLSAILTLSGIMFVICIGVGLFGGINTFAFMAAECVLLGIRTSHVLTRYTIFLYDMRHGGINNESISWDKRGSVSYYIELVFEMAALLIDLLHNLHMLFWSNIFLSMASLVIIMQLRYLVHEIQRKFKRHRNYLWVLNHMEKSYPLASQDDLSQNSDNCAICWEKMDTARKLPCGHLFHNSCLQSWLEQDTSCPTCRLALSVQSNVPTPMHPNIPEPEPQNRANNHFFRFNGSRYVSWLPNFSVEVTHINNLLRADMVPQTTLVTHTSQIRNMARQVQQMFPRFPISVIIADLQVTRSMELTVDNILEGRLIVPAHFQADDEFEESNATAVGATGTASSSSNSSSQEEGPSYGYRANPANDYYVNPSRFAQFTDSSSSSTPASSPERESSPTTSGFDSGYEIERNSNIFGNQNDLLRDESVDLDYIPLGDRFSKSSNEREKILARRKEMMLAQARKRFLDKNKSPAKGDESAAVAGQSGDAATGVRHRSKISISE